MAQKSNFKTGAAGTRLQHLQSHVIVVIVIVVVVVVVVVVVDVAVVQVDVGVTRSRWRGRPSNCWAATPPGALRSHCTLWPEGDL